MKTQGTKKRQTKWCKSKLVHLCVFYIHYNNLAPTPMTNATNIGISQRPFTAAAFAVTTATLLVGVGTNAVPFPFSFSDGVADDVTTGYTVELDGTSVVSGS